MTRSINLLSIILFFFSTMQLARMQPLTKLAKQAVTTMLKHDIYRTFYQEIGIISARFYHVTKGNTQLEQDLEELYFGPGRLTQEKITAFCKKWDLEHLDIDELIKKLKAN